MDHKRFPGGATYQFEIKPVVGNTFINMDGEEHNRYRQLAMPAFRSRAVNRFVETDLTPLAHEIVSRFVNRGEGDLVTDFADVMPFWAISRKLGLPVGAKNSNACGRTRCSAIRPIPTARSPPRARSRAS